MVNFLDRCIVAADVALRTLAGAGGSARARPAPPFPETPLTMAERRFAGALMRVNHAGEVCAQAMYQAQSLTARSGMLRLHMEQAARDEADHLHWTRERLRELDDGPSLLNPLWYAGAFAIGLVAGRAGDRWSLGFVVETERQVEEHLAGHLNRLPAHDDASRVIIARMMDDEAHHRQRAQEAGAQPLPPPLRSAMRLAAKVMTRTAHHL
jgi:ubiquinone biosynthesis monooxygenase Coq7